MLGTPSDLSLVQVAKNQEKVSYFLSGLLLTGLSVNMFGITRYCSGLVSR